MSDSQEQVRNLFGLSKEEKVLDDFGCSLSETLSIKGRLYLTENYICFSSNLFGFNRKYCIAINEIIELRLKKTSIEIDTKNPIKKNYSFSSFNNVQIVYKRIKSMCSSYNDNLTTNLSESKKNEVIPILLSDSENSDEESDEIVTTTSRSNKNSVKSNNSNEESPPKKDTTSAENESNNIINTSSKEGNIINDSSEPKKRENSPDKNEKGMKKNKSMKDLSLNEKLKINEINKNSNTDIKRKKSSGSVKRKNSDSQNDPLSQSNISQIKNLDDPEEIKFEQVDESFNEICRKVISLNPKDFFDKYLSGKNLETAYHKYYEWVGDYSEINFPEWEKIENKENPEIEKFQRIETFTLALHGVPLVNKSNVEKTSIYWIAKDGTYYLSTSSKSSGVPLSDCFLVQTGMEIHPYMNNTKSVLRTYVRTYMLKSTLFKSALLSQGKKSYGEEVKKWFQFIEEKGDKIEEDYVYRPRKRKNSLDNKHKLLSHGVEKEISQLSKEKHIVEFSDFVKDIFCGIKNYSKMAYDFYFREFDKNTRFILACFFIVFLLLLNVISRQNKEIMELKKGFNEMKTTLANLTNLVLELKGKEK